MKLQHSIPEGLVEVWRKASDASVRRHLSRCNESFGKCVVCAVIVLLISEGHFSINDEKEEDHQD